VKTGWVRRILAIVYQFLLATAALRAQSPSEFEVKAAFLLNFARFIEWPEAALAPDEPIHICVIGEDPFGRALDQLVHDESIDSHKVVVVRAPSSSDSTCEVAYFGKAGKEAARTGAGVLTVGEGVEFLRSGGMIAFVLENRRVRFDINLPAMRKAGVRVSSRLLRVARTVVP
jgi:hypothetical protein